MVAESKTVIKSYFERGDRPTQGQFANLIDSYQDANSNLSTLASAGLGSVGLSVLSATTTAQAQNSLGIVVAFNNFTATTSPTVNDDSGDGYGAGSIWVNTTTDTYFVCVDAALGAAVWRASDVLRAGGSAGAIIQNSSGQNCLIGGAGGSQGVSTVGKLVTAASATGAAGFNLPPGTAPSSPADGDLWTTTAGTFARINGVTKQLDSNFQLGTAVSASGTSVNFSAPFSGVTRVTINISEVSTNGSDQLLIQIGDSGGVETSGYLSASSVIQGATPASSGYTNGFGIRINDASFVSSGSYVLNLLEPSTNTWSGFGNFAETTTALLAHCAGRKLLSDQLTSIRITTTGGVNTFDAGKINVIWE